jgi:cell shape-determining protein MreC
MRKQHTINYQLPTISLLLVVSLCLGFEYYSKGFFRDRLMAVQSSLQQSVSSVTDYFGDRALLINRARHLRARNLDLRQSLAQSRFQLSQQQSWASENQHLKRMLGIKSMVRDPLFTQPIRVIQSQSDRSIYAKRPPGKVAVGMLVMNEDGVVIGRVASVLPASLRILLLNDKKSALSVVVSDQYVNAVAIGNGQGVDLMHMPIDSAVKAGDVVRTVQVYDDGVNYQTLGTVDSVQNSPDRTFLIAKLSQTHVLTSYQWLILI